MILEEENHRLILSLCSFRNELVFVGDVDVSSTRNYIWSDDFSENIFVDRISQAELGDIARVVLKRKKRSACRKGNGVRRKSNFDEIEIIVKISIEKHQIVETRIVNVFQGQQMSQEERRQFNVQNDLFVNSFAEHFADEIEIK